MVLHGPPCSIHGLLSSNGNDDNDNNNNYVLKGGNGIVTVDIPSEYPEFPFFPPSTVARTY